MHVFFQVISQINQQVFIFQYMMGAVTKEMYDHVILLPLLQLHWKGKMYRHETVQKHMELVNNC